MNLNSHEQNQPSIYFEDVALFKAWEEQFKTLNAPESNSNLQAGVTQSIITPIKVECFENSANEAEANKKVDSSSMLKKSGNLSGTAVMSNSCVVQTDVSKKSNPHKNQSQMVHAINGLPRTIAQNVSTQEKSDKYNSICKHYRQPPSNNINRPHSSIAVTTRNPQTILNQPQRLDTAALEKSTVHLTSIQQTYPNSGMVVKTQDSFHPRYQTEPSSMIDSKGEASLNMKQSATIVDKENEKNSISKQITGVSTKPPKSFMNLTKNVPYLHAEPEVVVPSHIQHQHPLFDLNTVSPFLLYYFDQSAPNSVLLQNDLTKKVAFPQHTRRPKRNMACCGGGAMDFKVDGKVYIDKINKDAFKTLSSEANLSFDNVFSEQSDSNEEVSNVLQQRRLHQKLRSTKKSCSDSSVLFSTNYEQNETIPTERLEHTIEQRVQRFSRIAVIQPVPLNGHCAKKQDSFLTEKNRNATKASSYQRLPNMNYSTFDLASKKCLSKFDEKTKATTNTTGKNWWMANACLGLKNDIDSASFVESVSSATSVYFESEYDDETYDDDIDNVDNKNWLMPTKETSCHGITYIPNPLDHQYLLASQAYIKPVVFYDSEKNSRKNTLPVSSQDKISEEIIESLNSGAQNATFCRSMLSKQSSSESQNRKLTSMFTNDDENNTETISTKKNQIVCCTTALPEMTPRTPPVSDDFAGENQEETDPESVLHTALTDLIKSSNVAFNLKAETLLQKKNESEKQTVSLSSFDKRNSSLERVLEQHNYKLSDNSFLKNINKSEDVTRFFSSSYSESFSLDKEIDNKKLLHPSESRLFSAMSTLSQKEPIKKQKSIFSLTSTSTLIDSCAKCVLKTQENVMLVQPNVFNIESIDKTSAVSKNASYSVSYVNYPMIEYDAIITQTSS